jgi:hypothetical protein
VEQTTMKDILVPISPGELLDKITILRIKSARMTDPAKLVNVRQELAELEKTWRNSVGAEAGVPALSTSRTTSARPSRSAST